MIGQSVRRLQKKSNQVMPEIKAKEERVDLEDILTTSDKLS